METEKKRPKGYEKRFECRVAMYLHHRGIKSILYGSSLADALKRRNQRCIHVYVEDEDGTPYYCKEHDEPDAAGYYNYYWEDEKGNVIFDEEGKKDQYKKVEPIKITDCTTESGWVTPDGLFYECSFEQHWYLADFLFESNTIPQRKNLSSDPEGELENRGWVKLSHSQIRYKRDEEKYEDGINKTQKDVLLDYFMEKQKPIYVWGRKYTLQDFLEERF